MSHHVKRILYTSGSHRQAACSEEGTRDGEALCGDLARGFASELTNLAMGECCSVYSGERWSPPELAGIFGLCTCRACVYACVRVYMCVCVCVPSSAKWCTVKCQWYVYVYVCMRVRVRVLVRVRDRGNCKELRPGATV